MKANDRQGFCVRLQRIQYILNTGKDYLEDMVASAGRVSQVYLYFTLNIIRSNGVMRFTPILHPSLLECAESH